MGLIKEIKMKKSDLKELIREEIQKVLGETVNIVDKIEDLLTKIDKLQKQNKDLLKIIAEMNEEDEFQDCIGE